jgi:hypothetical protein
MGGQKFAHGFFGVLAADAGEHNCDAGFARRDFPKRRGFFFQGEADECGHFGRAPRQLLRGFQIADAGHREQRQDVRQVALIYDHDMSSSQGDVQTVGHFIFFTIGHSD